MIIECGTDKKLLWRCIKNQIGDQKELPSCISVAGIMIQDSNKIADEMNKFFVQSIQDINKSIPRRPFVLDYYSMSVPEWKEFTCTNEKELIDIIKGIRTKSGINNVNKSVVLSSFSVYGAELTSLFNKSLCEGVFPDAIKTTVVCPIPKIKNTCKIEEMRPINNAEVLDKILQTVVKKQLQSHVDRYKLLSPQQSAYRENYS